mmetsp:Transcript_21493/g.73599  ORF Transcript_21493/g.73599 Transcript_21493/m.73599 type:complete len:211 (-) Transcript_21493:700-1332(-)
MQQQVVMLRGEPALEQHLPVQLLRRRPRRQGLALRRQAAGTPSQSWALKCWAARTGWPAEPPPRAPGSRVAISPQSWTQVPWQAPLPAPARAPWRQRRPAPPPKGSVAAAPDSRLARSGPAPPPPNPTGCPRRRQRCGRVSPPGQTRRCHPTGKTRHHHLHGWCQGAPREAFPWSASHRWRLGRRAWLWSTSRRPQRSPTQRQAKRHRQT